MKTYQSALNLIGRILIVALFLPAGLSKLTGFEGTLVGGIALLVGFQTRLVAIILALFTLAAAVTGHAFWAAPADAAFIAQLLFFKNIAVMGGLLVLASAGAGSFSFDGRKEAK